jgi:hypothetical protein
MTAFMDAIITRGSSDVQACPWLEQVLIPLLAAAENTILESENVLPSPEYDESFPHGTSISLATWRNY